MVSLLQSKHTYVYILQLIAVICGSYVLQSHKLTNTEWMKYVYWLNEYWSITPIWSTGLGSTVILWSQYFCRLVHNIILYIC